MKPPIWNAILQALRRIIPATKMNTSKALTGTVVNRRIEVTVERESVSMWVRGSTTGGEGVATVNGGLDRGLSSGSGPKENPAATPAATPLGAVQEFPKGGKS